MDARSSSRGTSMPSHLTGMSPRGSFWLRSNIPGWSVSVGVAILSMLGQASARASLITNGSFETPVVPVAGFTNFNSGSTAITGWTVVGRQVSIVNTQFTQGGLNFPAEDGAQWLDLTGDGANSSEGVQQAVATTPGATYDVSFYVGNVVGGSFGVTSTVDVLVDGHLIQAATNSSGGSTLTWQQFTTSFAATSSSTLIEFLNGDPPGDNSNGLDNVVVTQVATTPEPSTVTLFALAMVSILVIPRLRKVTLRGNW